MMAGDSFGLERGLPAVCEKCLQRGIVGPLWTRGSILPDPVQRCPPCCVS